MASSDTVNVSVGKSIGGLFTVLIVIFLVACLFAWPFKKAPADKIALSYGGGIFEGAQFQSITNPGSGIKFNGWADKWYQYPVTVRNYIASNVEGEGDRKTPGTGAIQASASNGPTVTWELAVNFKINTSKIRDFHERLGLKYKAWGDTGWDQLLDENLRQHLEAAVQSESRRHSTDEYQRDPDVIDSVRTGIAKDLKANVNTLLGADYFCGPTYQLGSTECPDFEVIVKKPILPEEIVKAYDQQEATKQGIVVAQNQAKQKEEQARGDKLAKDALVGVFNDPAYIAYLEAQALLECARNSNCTIVSTPGNTGILVAPR